ncbi:MAG: 50S ribosomal protein L25 [bacterium]|nr:50S ribosomal protein L25 [bacterium]
MPAKQVIHATKRDVFGKQLNSHRAKGRVPANLYSKDIESIAIWLDTKELRTILKEVSESTLLELALEGENKTRPVILRHVEENMFKPQVIHVDVQQVNLKEKMVINIAVEIIGESQLVLDGIGLLETPIAEIEVEALPADLPESFIVDISVLTELGQHILVKDLTVPHGVEVLTDSEAILALITEPSQEEEVAEPIDEAAAVADVETAEGDKEEEKSE